MHEGRRSVVIRLTKFDREERNMGRPKPRVFLLFLATMLMAPAEMLALQAAQEPGIQWQTDLEAAKTLAKQTGRHVLVHFWTPSCGPCLTLDQTVFNQANVAAVIEQRFVPVKLNANENSATAQGFGITRVPTDVLLTADGQVIGKLISPPTPAGYITEVMQVAANYQIAPGSAFAAAAARAPAPSNMPANVNAAYASLPIASGTVPAAPEFGNAASQINSRPAALGVSPSPSFMSSGAATNPAGQPPITPIGSTPPASQSVAAAPVPAAPTAPVQVENRYAAPPFNTPAMPGEAAASSVAAGRPTGTQPAFAGQPPLQVALPAQPGGQSPTLITGSSASALTMQPGIGGPISTAGVGAPSAAAPQGQPPNAATTTAEAAAPDASQLPAGAPPLGFDGYCPVSMRNSWKWVPGDPRWGIVHRGRTYWFASQNEQQQFWADPDRFSPALSGMDPVMAIDHQQQVPGKREHSIDYDNLFYMFSSEATLAQFTANPERYAVGVRQAMGIQRGRLVR